MADDYRLFAKLVSPLQDRRRHAVELLSSHLAGVEPYALAQLAIQLGHTCRREPMTRVRRESVPSLEPELLASIVCRGTALLRSWPLGLITWVRDEYDRNIGDLGGYHAVRTLLKRLGNPLHQDAEQVRLIREALPEEFASFAYSGARRPFATTTQLARRTSIRPRQIRLVRNLLEDRRLPSTRRIRSQLNVERVEDFGISYENSVPLRALTFKLMLPTYALEQMVCMKLLEEEKDPAVRLARGGTCVRKASYAALLEILASKERRGTPPAFAEPLETAARRIGGREKPWGAIMKALCEGAEYWLAGERITSRSILVIPSTLARFDHLQFEPTDYPGFGFATVVNKAEVEEILNIAPKYLPQLISAGHLNFRSEGGAMVTGKAQVLLVAELMVAPAELGALTGQTGASASREARRRHQRRFACGWSRYDLVSAGVIPAPVRARRSR